MTRFGRSGALRQGELCRGPVDSVGVWQVWRVGFRWIAAGQDGVWFVLLGEVIKNE